MKNNEIIKRNTELELGLINTLGSFENKLQNASNLDFIYDIKNKSIADLTLNTNTTKLTSYEISRDKLLIQEINETESMKETIIKFNSLNNDIVSGNNETKRIIIEIIKKIKNREFIEDENNKEIYLAFMNFKEKININYLELYRKLDFDSELIKNTVSYIILGIDPNIENITDFSKNINVLVSCAVSPIYKSITENENIDDFINNKNNEIDESKNDTNKDLDKIEESKKSIIKWIYKGCLLIVKGYPIYTTIGASTFLVVGYNLFSISNISKEISSTLIGTPVNNENKKGGLLNQIGDFIINFAKKYLKDND